MIEVRFTPTKAEVTGGVRAELVRRPAILVFSLAVVVVVVVGIVIANVALVAAGVIAAIWMLAMMVWLPTRAWARFVELAPGELNYVFDEDGVTTSASSVSGTVDWPAITGAIRSHELYVFKTKGNRRVMIPTRAFATPADDEAFRELVNRKLDASL